MLDKSSISFGETLSLSARIFICVGDSSPDTYKTFLFFDDSMPHTCNITVDLPIPGSPPINTTEPFTIPPPSTWSSSLMPVLKRTCSIPSIFLRKTGVFFGV